MEKKKRDEIDEIPLFMTELPKDVENNPDLAGLQSLLYDASNDDLAEHFKVCLFIFLSASFCTARPHRLSVLYFQFQNAFFVNLIY
jgi:hypothetical protein